MGTTLEDLSNAVTEVASTAATSVVGVGANGSGVVIGRDLVLTNAHNLRQEEPVVTFADGRRVTATVAGADPEGDLALLSVETAGAPPVAWSDRPPRLGETVVALAHPGGRGLRVSMGVVSALDVAFRGPGGRRITGAVGHSAPLARGSSGGPVVTGDGRLLGIDTHREGDGFYLAIRADAGLRAHLDALSRGEVPRRARLGVAIAPPRVARRLREAVGLPEREGLLVHGVEQASPADRAGIRHGDLIVAVEGRSVGSPDDLAAALEAAGADASVTLEVVRGVEELEVAVDLRAAGASDEGSV